MTLPRKTRVSVTLFIALHAAGDSTGSGSASSRPALREQALAFAGRAVLPRRSLPGSTAAFQGIKAFRSALFIAFHVAGDATGSGSISSRPALREQALAFAGRAVLLRRSPPGSSAALQGTKALRSALFIAFHVAGDSTGSASASSRPALREQAFAGKAVLLRRSPPGSAAALQARAFALNIAYSALWRFLTN